MSDLYGELKKRIEINDLQEVSGNVEDEETQNFYSKKAEKNRQLKNKRNIEEALEIKLPFILKDVNRDPEEESKQIFETVKEPDYFSKDKIRRIKPLVNEEQRATMKPESLQNFGRNSRNR